MELNETDTPIRSLGGTRVADVSAGGRLCAAATETSDQRRLLMRADGLRKAFGGQMVLDEVDFELHEGQVVLLRGANGSGKTTLLNMLTGHIKPDAGMMELRTTGAVEHFHFPKKWWQELNPWDRFLPERVAREGVGRSWQDTRLFSTLNLLDNIVVAGHEDRHGHNPARILFSPRHTRRIDLESEERASCLLKELGLGDRGQSSADKVSLGQTKRVAIARAVHAGAKILFLDEPLSGLDAPGVKSVLDLLKSLMDSHRLTLVIVEHVQNAQHILPLADTLWTLDQGTLLRETKCSSHDQLDDCSGHKNSRDVADLFPEYSQTQSFKLPHDAVLDVYRQSGEESGDPLLEVRNLVVFRGKRLVIGPAKDSVESSGGLGFTLRSGDLAVLRAPNGWGKTTLLDAIAGSARIQDGALRLCGSDISQRPSWARSRLGMRYFRSNDHGFPSLRIDDVLKLTSSRDCASMSLPSRARYSELSGGQKKRAMLCLASDNSQACLRVALLDEPFTAFDTKATSEAVGYITQILDSGRNSVLIATP